MKKQGSEVAQLASEIRKLRIAIERQEQALLNARDAARYMGISHPTFHVWVRRGLVAQTFITPDSPPRYARVYLDRLIEQKTGESAHA